MRGDQRKPLASAVADWEGGGLGRISGAADLVTGICCRMWDVEAKEDRTGRGTLDTVVSFTAPTSEHPCGRLDVPSLLYAMVLALALNRRGLC